MAQVAIWWSFASRKSRIITIQTFTVQGIETWTRTLQADELNEPAIPILPDLSTVKQPPFLVPESQLLPRLARRDEQAFSWLYDQYAHVLYGVVLTIVEKPNLAAQVVEDVFVQAWADFDSYSPRQSSLMTWLLTRARKAAYTVFTPQTTSAVAKNSQDSTDVDNLLTTEHRTLLYSMYFRGQSAEETAGIVQVPIQGLRKLVQATLQELKHIFSR